MKKNILVVDDSALMRRVVCDIIQLDGRYQVEDVARDGKEAYELVKTKQYDAMILDINMPRMNGLELLELMQKERIRLPVIMASTLTTEGAKETLRALELGAFDFVTKPGNFVEARGLTFRDLLSKALGAAYKASEEGHRIVHRKPVKPVIAECRNQQLKKVVGLACSTGGPRALQSVIPYLPKNLDAAVLLVQHMPAGFTATLAERLNDMSEVEVKEAVDGELISKGCVYIAPGGKHMICARTPQGHIIKITDDPPRDALKPSANTMYESFAYSSYEEVVCVVLTGMGADGTKGIKQLKNTKKLYVIAQDAASSVVYGMPKSVADAGLVNEVVSLEAIAAAITKNVGVH